MYQITMGVCGKKLFLIEEHKHEDIYVEGSVIVDEIEFKFSGAEWENLTKSATFITPSGKIYNRLLVDDKCVVPAEVYKETGNVGIGVYGYIIENDVMTKLLPSTLISKEILNGAYKKGVEPGEILTPTQWEIYYQQISALVEDLEGRIPTKTSQLENDSGFITDVQAYSKFKKVEDYLYEAWFSAIDYDFAYNFFKNQTFEMPVGECSSVRKGNFYGRNLDWLYNEQVEFIVNIPRLEGRYASIGMGTGGAKLTKALIESGEYSELYKIIPFTTLDGINEYGVFMNTNVVPQDYGETTGTTPTGTQEVELATIMLPRYVLDHFKSATEAANYIREHVRLYATKSLARMGYETHFMLGDSEKTYLVEIRNNELYIEDMTEGANGTLAGKSYMTNFYLSNVVFNDNGKVYTPEYRDGEWNAETYNLISEHGSGLERYNLIVDNFATLNSRADMREMMNALTYTNAYKETTSPFWFTEFVGDDITVASNVSDFAAVVQIAEERFANRSRDPESPYYGTWHTIHSSVYDIEKRKLYIKAQENATEHEYELEYYYTAKETDALLIKTIVWEKGTGINSVVTKGNNNNAAGESSVAEGSDTDAHSFASHTEGYMTSTGASADYSHAEGYKTTTQGQASHAEGDNTITNNPAEHAEGRYNKSNMGGTSESNTLHSVGIGNASGSVPGGERRNAFEIMQNGDAYLKGVGNYDGTNYSEAETIQDVLEDKQDIIEDLEQIRAGAALGETAVQDANYVHTDNNFTDGYIYDIETAQQNIETLSDAVSGHDQEIQNINGDIEEMDEDIVQLGYDVDNLDVNKQDKTDNGLQTTSKQVVGAINEINAGLDDKVNVADIQNNTTSTAINKPLSANMGKELQDQINNLKMRGRYLSIWNCTTGLAETTPTVDPYIYKAGDYFIVGVVGTTNYRPSGTQYSASTPSTAIETEDVKVNATYYYDGSVWTLLDIGQIATTFGSLAGSPYDNANLAGVLNEKQNTIDNENKLDADLVDDTETTNKFVTSQEKQTWNGKQNALTAGSNITIDENNVISATGGSGSDDYTELSNKPQINGTELNGNKTSAQLGIIKVVDIGSYQYSYESYILPAIQVADLRVIYTDDKAGIPQVLYWTLYGSENNLKVVSSDHIADEYSIDVLVHNKYHCAYTWTDETTGLVNPTVQAQQEVPTFTNNSLGVIKGSETDGNVGANVDGTGSINGWTQVKNRITILEGAVPTKVKDVKLNSTSIVNSDKEAIIPIATDISDSPVDSKLITEKALYDYVASGNNGNARLLSSADLDYIYNTGFYFCNMCSHRPVTANGILIVSKINNDTNYAVQIYLAFAEDKAYIRFRDNNAWKSWTKLFNEGNIAINDITGLTDELDLKLAISNIINNVTSTDTDKPLSANMGKELNDRIQNLASIGKYLAMWDCSTGLPTTNPIEMPYSYTTGDYYVISNIGTTNYMPNGSTYTGSASTTVYSGTETLNIGDFFYYDGSVWSLMKNTGKTVAFENIAGSPMDNSNLANVLNGKVGFEDYATSSKGGVFKIMDDYGTNMSNGYLLAGSRSYAQYQSYPNNLFIGKGTLENVLTGKGLVKSTTISSASTDDNVVTPKAVYDFIMSLDANNVEY